MSHGMDRMRPITGKHVALAIALFFLSVFAVNGVFVYVSLNTHPGVTSEDAYREGLRFNSRLETADRQSAQGWKVTVAPSVRSIELGYRDSAGAPISGLVVTVRAGRPIHDDADLNLRLKEVASGTYRTDGFILAQGRWSLVIEAHSNGRRQHRLEHEVWVRK